MQQNNTTFFVAISITIDAINLYNIYILNLEVVCFSKLRIPLALHCAIKNV